MIPFGGYSLAHLSESDQLKTLGLPPLADEYPSPTAAAPRSTWQPTPTKEQQNPMHTPTCGHAQATFPIEGKRYCQSCAPRAWQHFLHRGHADEPAAVRTTEIASDAV